MRLLERYRCHRAETKRVLIRGIEDGFSPEGEERAVARPGLESPRLASLFRTDYDGSQPDRIFLDHVEVPANISGGLLVVSLRPVVENSNDYIVIGRMTWGRSADPLPAFGAFLPSLAERPGWNRTGPVHYAELGAIRLARETASPLRGPRERPTADPSSTLLDFVRSDGERTAIDIQVADDTAVDFIAVALCERPPSGTGLSLIVEPTAGIAELVHLSCDGGSAEDPRCDPYVGGTPCAAALPVACFRDLGLPRPKALAEPGHAGAWSGGEVAFTPARRGSDFTRVTDVDAFCRGRFGADWRTASHHDGGRGGTLIGRGRPPEPHRRAWVDIKGQPYATCWSR